MLATWERKIRRNICWPVCVCGRGIWRAGSNEQFHNLHRGTLIVTDNQVRRLELLGHLIRMENNKIFKVALVAKLEVKKNFGRPKLRRLSHIEADLKMIGIKVRRRKTQDRSEWMVFYREAEVIFQGS